MTFRAHATGGGRLLAFALLFVATACASAAPAAPTAAPAPPTGANPTAAPAATSAPAATTAPAATAAPGKPQATAAAATSPGRAALRVGYSEVYEGELPLWVARDAGIFDKQGLDVDLRYTASSTGLAALLAGEIDIFMGGGSEMISAVSKGTDLVAVGSLVPVYPYQMMVSRKIQSVGDLRGARIGISSPGALADIATRDGLKRQGLDPDRDVTILAVGSSQNRTAALLNGALDGELEQPPSSVVVEKQGFHVLFDLATLRIPTMNNGIVVRKSWLQSRRDVMQRYVDSIVQAIARMKSDRALTEGVIKKELKTDDADAVAETYKFSTEEIFPDYPHPTVEQLAESADILGAKDPAVKNLDLATVIDDSFVKSAEARGVAKS